MATNSFPSTSNNDHMDGNGELMELNSGSENVENIAAIQSPSSQDNTVSATIDDLTAEEVTSKMPDRTDEEFAAQICVETILKLLNDPHKMCHLLKLNDSTNRQQQQPTEMEEVPTLPEIVFSLKKAFSDRTVLSRAARHFQNISDDSLYYLTTLIPSSRDMDDILKTVVEETRCMTPDGLQKLIHYLCDLIAETVPKKFRLDKMLSMTKEELEEAEMALPLFDGDYNREDWLSVCTCYARSGGVYRLFDASNITLQDVLKEFAAQYKGKMTEELWNCSKNAAEYRASDSKYQKAFTCADAPDYEKIYNFLSTMAGCRHVTNKDINRMDAAIITNIFQEMEELITTEFDTLGRQMPILREQMKTGECVPDTGFNEEDVAEIEANTLHFPSEFRNPYELEMKRRGRFEGNSQEDENNITEGPEIDE
uniref:Uncharacterized protein n=1 Tax=Panagrolaimus superbus TaxID=310955 RepID=A0A914YX48_9BILA